MEIDKKRDVATQSLKETLAQLQNKCAIQQNNIRNRFAKEKKVLLAQYDSELATITANGATLPNNFASNWGKGSAYTKRTTRRMAATWQIAINLSTPFKNDRNKFRVMRKSNLWAIINLFATAFLVI